MVLDNGELVKTGDKGSVDDFLKLGAGIGGGVGASFVFAEGSVVGAALIATYGAAGLGLAASLKAGIEVGTVIGETEFIRDSLVELMESLVPIPDGSVLVEQPQVDWSWAPGENFTANFGNESIEVSFYADAPGLEGFGIMNNNEIDFFSNPYEVEIIGGGGFADFWNNYSNCGASGGILP